MSPSLLKGDRGDAILCCAVLGLNKIMGIYIEHRGESGSVQLTSGPFSFPNLFRLVTDPLPVFQLNLQGAESTELTETSEGQRADTSLENLLPSDNLAWTTCCGAWKGMHVRTRVCVCTCVSGVWASLPDYLQAPRTGVISIISCSSPK